MGIVLICGYINRNPSMADEIEMDGVINPSAIKVPQPTTAGMISHFAFRFLKSAYKANIPPSPLLSAFRAR